MLHNFPSIFVFIFFLFLSVFNLLLFFIFLSLESWVLGLESWVLVLGNKFNLGFILWEIVGTYLWEIVGTYRVMLCEIAGTYLFWTKSRGRKPQILHKSSGRKLHKTGQLEIHHWPVLRSTLSSSCSCGRLGRGSTSLSTGGLLLVWWGLGSWFLVTSAMPPHGRRPCYYGVLCLHLVLVVVLVGGVLPYRLVGCCLFGGVLVLGSW